MFAESESEMAVYRSFDAYLKRFFPDEWKRKHAPTDPYEIAKAVVEASAKKHLEKLTKAGSK